MFFSDSPLSRTSKAFIQNFTEIRTFFEMGWDLEPFAAVLALGQISPPAVDSNYKGLKTTAGMYGANYVQDTKSQQTNCSFWGAGSRSRVPLPRIPARRNTKADRISHLSSQIHRSAPTLPPSEHLRNQLTTRSPPLEELVRTPAICFLSFLLHESQESLVCLPHPASYNFC